jgi:hypothetical protein
VAGDLTNDALAGALGGAINTAGGSGVGISAISNQTDFCSGGGQRFLETDSVDPHHLEKVEGFGVGAYNTQLPREFQITYMAIKVVR